MKTKLLTLLALGLFVAAGLSVADVSTSRSLAADTPTVTKIRTNIVGMLQRNPKVPIRVMSDIPGPGGAPRATNRDAAYYAWQEFIALNWPNVPVSGNAPSIGFGSREFADSSRRFGQPPRAGANSYPALVWESTRHRAEIYTPPVPDSSPSASPAPTPNGYKNTARLSWGYNSTPGYVYPGLKVSAAPTQPNSKAIKPGLTPFVNLDEASQIGLCKMYSAGEEVFFLAKANYMEYGYIASRGWYNSSLLKPPTATPTPFPGSPTKPVANFANTSGYIVTQGEFPKPGDLDGSTKTGKGPGSYVSFPNGTIEFKAAFRVATDAERKQYENGQPITGGYHAAPIRYYRQLDDTGTNFEYLDTVGVLLSLHIIHKTPTAPYFIFATFEHDDNVIGTNGQRVEDSNGNLLPNAFTSAAPSPPPSPFVYPSAGPSPSPGQYLVAATSPNVFEVPSQVVTPTPTPPAVTIQSFSPAPNENAGKVSATQSYYQNARNEDASQQPAANSPSPSDSYFTVNRRRFSIPQPILAVNQDIHNLIRMYGYKTPGGVSDIATPDNVWLHYKLVNVQWVPSGNAAQKTPGKLYGDTSGGAKPFIAAESYYLSNSLVETNLVLSAFSGQFAQYIPNVADGFSITDFYFAPQTYTNYNATLPPAMLNTGAPFYNVYTKGGPYNMGGCMGCHGNTSVNGGSDASFILAHGKPFGIEGIDPPPEVMRARFRGYFPQ